LNSAVAALVVAAWLSVGGVSAGAAEDASPAAAADQAAAGAHNDRLSEALARFNRGSAYLEQYRYAEAAKEYEKALQLFPDWTAAQFNLGLAYLNMQDQREASDAVDKSRDLFRQILEAHPDHLHARFCLGLYYQHAGNHERALECFEKVRQADPKDPYAAYKCAESLLALGRSEEGTKMLQRVVDLDPGFVSAIYRLATQYQRSRQQAKARPLFVRFQELNAAELTGGSFTVRPVYGAVGKYYTAIGVEGVPAAVPRAGRQGPIVFSPEVKKIELALKAWKWSGGSVAMPGIAIGDFNGDGSLDLCLTGAGDQGETVVLLNDGKGNFGRGPTLADKGVSPCAGDVNNQGHLDLWLGREGQDLLFLGDGKGGFRKAPSPSIPAGKALGACARLLDLDCDGDLDLLSFRLRSGTIPAGADSAAAASNVCNNNRDGAFPDIAEKLGLTLPDTAVAAVVYDDFDNDRDLDLVIFPRSGKPIAWVNDRAGQHHTRSAAETGLDVEGVLSATSGDPNQDGHRDLLVFTGKEARLYLNRGNFRFELDKEFANRCGSLAGTGGQFADMDNDGDLDIVIPDARRRDRTRGPVVLIHDSATHRFTNAADLDPSCLLSAIQTQHDASCVAADFNGDGRCDILLAEMGREPLVIENVTPGGHYLALDLQGIRPRDGKGRSNNSAIGARVEIRTGTLIQQHVVGVPSGPVAMPPLRIHAGLGANTRVEWLRIVWPDSVLQSEIDLVADRLTRIEEIPRKTASCPHLFAWNGTRYEFVADFGGMGGLGYRTGLATFAMPDPTEYVPIPRLEPIAGEYVLQVVEPLEEVVYFDEAKLVAVDHPAGTEIYPNEMAAVKAAPPPFEIFCVDRAIEPVRAVDHRGIDVTGELRRVDRRYAGATEPDPRFVGFAKDHFVELDFGDRLRGVSPQERLVLFLNGWVEYGYSSSNYAASQAGVRLKAPSVHVWRGGRWAELLDEVGYPAGLQHTMTVDLSGKIRPGDRKIRVSTNMEIYWDRIFLGTHRKDARLGVKEVPARRADLHFLGYPREYSPDGRQPNLLDYANIDRAVPWKSMAGDYTRYGEVTGLLGEADDCFVIFGHGEEVTLRFPAAAFGPVPARCRRTFLLKTDSYCKDMDLYTAFGDTVEPLPFHAMSSYPYGPEQRYPDNEKTRAWRRDYNTRRVSAGGH
jgi:tetratricopeptide (TPR) repeat protein